MLGLNISLSVALGWAPIYLARGIDVAGDVLLLLCFPYEHRSSYTEVTDHLWKSDTYFEPASSVTVAEGALLRGMMDNINLESS